MFYKRLIPPGGIEIVFQNAEEVETVRSAFEERALHLIDVGNDSSISNYQRLVIDRWEGDTRSYRGGSHGQILEVLTYFHEETDARADEILAERDNPDRIADSARRYEMGRNALILIEEIELQSQTDDKGELI